MFLGNLSSANEHKARKKAAKKKEEVSEEDSDPKYKRLRSSDKAVLYKNGDEIPRDVLLDFLVTCTKMMLLQSNIDEIVSDTFTKDLGLNMAAVEFQRDVLEYNFQIEKDFGCRYLSMIPLKHDGDNELMDAAKAFMFTAMKSYNLALRARSFKYKDDSSLKPKPNTPLPKKAIMEFFEGCNALMAMPETKEELKMVFKTTGQPPGPRVIEMQRSVLVLMGYDADYGVSCLNKVGQYFPGDREIMGKMQLYATCAEVSVMEATMSDQQRTDFYAQIPPMMHHFPHMFVLQQRQQMQQQMVMQQQSQMQSSSSRLNEIEALKSSGVLGLLSSPEGRVKIQELAGKVQSSRAKLEEDVVSWDAEKRSQYVANIAEHPALVKLTECGEDSASKIKTFIDMSEADIDQMMTLMLVMAQGGAEGSSNPAMGGVAATLGSLMNFNKFGPGPRPAPVDSASAPVGIDDHDHSHMHDHQHGPGCNHGPVISSNRKDVSSAKAESIDR